MVRNAAEKRQWYDGRLGLHCILTFLCFTEEPIGGSFTSSRFACRLLRRLDIWTIWWGPIHLLSTT